MSRRISHLPLRLTTGAFILNSGISKLEVDDHERDKRLHEAASQAYPSLKEMDPTAFARLLAVGELVVGAALLVPVVPTGVAGLALGAFSGGLIGLYMRTPAARRQGSVRPTNEGIPLAKDTWMAGIAATLLIDAATERLSRVTKRASKAKK